MAKLSKREQEVLDKLSAKLEAPDAPAIGRSASFTIDMGDPKQVALAMKHGLLGSDDLDLDDDDADADADADADKDDTPKRKGYFGQ